MHRGGGEEHFELMHKNCCPTKGGMDKTDVSPHKPWITNRDGHEPPVWLFVPVYLSADQVLCAHQRRQDWEAANTCLATK